MLVEDNVVINATLNANGVTAGAKKVATASKSAKKELQEVGGSLYGINKLANEFQNSAAKFNMASNLIMKGTRLITDSLIKGIAAAEAYNMRVIQSAAVITSIFSESNNGDFLKTYEQATAYAEDLQKVFIKINNQTLANVKQMNLVNLELNKQGVLIDLNSEKSVKGFTNLTNAIAIMTAGMQNQNMQFGQEIRALMEGNIRQGSTLALFLKRQLGPNMKAVVEEWKSSGTFLENVDRYLKGFEASSGKIKLTWEAISTTFESTSEFILSKGFKELYQEVMRVGQAINDYLIDNSDELASSIETSLSSFTDFLKGIGDKEVGKAFEIIGKGIKLVADNIDILGVALTGVAAGGLLKFAAVIAKHPAVITFMGLAVAGTEIGKWLTENVTPEKGDAFVNSLLRPAGKGFGSLKSEYVPIGDTSWYMNKKADKASNKRYAPFPKKEYSETSVVEKAWTYDANAERMKKFNEEIAKTNNVFVQINEAVDAMELKMTTFAENVAEIFTGMFEALQSGMSNLFFDWMRSGKDWATITTKIWNTLLDDIAKLIADFMAKEAIKMFLAFVMNFFAPGSGDIVQMIPSTTGGVPKYKYDAYADRYNIGLPGGKSSFNSFDVGTSFVPEDQFAYIHKGEMIIPAKEADGIRNGNTSGLIERLDKLIEVSSMNKYAIVDESGLGNLTRAINNKNFEFKRYALA